MSEPLKPMQRNILCSEMAETVKKCMETLFRTENSYMSQSRNTIITPANQSSSSSTANSIGDLDKIDHDIMVKDLQIDVLRRTMERTRRDLEHLHERRRNHYDQRDSHSVADPSNIPHLPEEIIARIFHFAYDRDYENSGRQTVRRFLQDDNTPDELRRIALQAIPVVIADSSDVKLRSHIQTVSFAVGPDPTLLSTNELDSILPSTPVSVLVAKKNWPSEEALQALNSVRWERLMITHESRDDEDQQNFVLDLLQTPGVLQKLQDVEHLVIPLESIYLYVNNPYAPDGQTLRLRSKTIEVDEKKVPRLRKADLPLPLLTSLRPILIGITELRVIIQPFVVNFNLTVDALRPLAATLQTLDLHGPTEYWPRTTRPLVPLLPIRQETPISFTELKYLGFHSISEKNCRDMISIFHSPVLEELSVGRTHASEARFEAIYDASQYVSTDFLHEKLPSIKCIHIYTNDKQHGLSMLNDLAKPDSSGRWLLPNLDVIMLDSVRNFILKKLTEIVTNRLVESRRIPVSPIRSVTLRGFGGLYRGTLQESYLSTLNLLVTEVKLID
ncbi:hypothetical protein SCHPADRAFT_152321 [Schizopora paradoxa]|uniref:Uncharacterized protein n=1 Tax=Schizopora paradoxa TaxID=27342 RepID=A0A0H2S0V0_9AGAM|nr:hypothetical protein SCHPADRAFT_152321 [Schizopora paradoxa]